MAKKTLDKVDKSKTETFGLLCCETGPLSLAYNINKTGFVCGEKAKMNIKVKIAIIVSKHINIHGSYFTLFRLTMQVEKR